MASNDDSQTIVAFDLYGTLLSTESIAEELAVHCESEKAKTIIELWRRYQLEYTWRLNSMYLYKPFSTITRAALLHALSESDVKLSRSDFETIIEANDSLGPFPDVEPALQFLLNNYSIEPYIFSNGTKERVSSCVNLSPLLYKFGFIFKGLVTMEEVQMFKPAPRVYEHLAEKVGREGDLGSV